MARRCRRVVPLLAACMASGPAFAQPSSPGPYVGGGAGVLVQTEADAFGGYFCCEGDAGGVVPAVWADIGAWLSPSVALGAEVTAMRAFTIDISAPRFVQQTRHRDTFLAGVLTWRPRGPLGGPAIVAGGGVALSRTRRSFRMLDVGTPPRPSEPPGIIDENGSVPFVTAGIDGAIALGRRVALVPRLRAIYVSRDEDVRAQDGLGHWTFVFGAGLRIGG